jgi:hypothetical protein
VTTDSRRTDLVLRVFEELLSTGRYDDGLRPGDIGTRLRELGTPLGSWEIRYELTALERLGTIALDEATGRWHPARTDARRKRGAR